MGYVCPKDVKKMLVQQARSVYEYEEFLREGDLVAAQEDERRVD